MKKVVLLFLFICVIYNVKAQLDCMQGLWADTYNGGNEYNEFSFTIIRKHKSLNFAYTAEKYTVDFPLIESIKGFLDYNPKSNGSLNVEELKENGEFYVVLDVKFIKNGQIKNSFIIVPEYFECFGESMSIGGGQLTELIKIERLPSFALKLLYNRGKKDNRNYIKEYLDIKVKEITIDKSRIFNNDLAQTKMYLIKGDVVTVLEEKDDWIKIEFLGTKLAHGWIKKSDVK